MDVFDVLGLARAGGLIWREHNDVIKQSFDVNILAVDALHNSGPTSSLGAVVITSDNDVLDRFAGSVCPSSGPALPLYSPKQRCHDSLSGLNVYMFFSLRCLTVSLGTAHLLTPMAEPRLADISNRSSDSTSGSFTSSFSAW